MATQHETQLDTQLDTVTCSFCGKGATEVNRLIAGPDAWICDGCVRAAHGILSGLEQDPPPAAAVPDPVLAEIAGIRQTALRGDRAGAAAAFTQLWQGLDPDAPPLHRATLAHYMADVQDDPAEELEWDRRALAAAQPAAADPGIAGLLASLHVNVAADLERAGSTAEAREHLAAAGAAQEHLPPDGYGDLVRTEIADLRGRLG